MGPASDDGFSEPVPADAALDEEERRLLASLPAPPPIGDVAVSHLWIVDWVGDGEPRVGAALRRGLDARRNGWARIVACRGKRDVLSAIHAATYFARNSGARPILHIEASSDARGLHATGAHDAGEALAWSELLRPLRRLNIATRCNLVLAVDSQPGRAADSLLAGGGARIPCVAVIGPDAQVPDAPRLAGLLALYRRWIDGEPGLEAASRHMAPARMGAVSMVARAHARLMRALILATRQCGAEERGQHLAALMQAMDWPADAAAPAWPLLPRRIARLWQSMFMIDLQADNRARFDFDARAATWGVLRRRGIA